jgi:hypothetical protein
MALTEYPELEQGSEQWLEARRGLVTASTVGQLLTATGRPASNDTSRRLTLSLVAERITGYVEPVWVNDDMRRGQLDEPIARDLYTEHIAPHMTPATETGFMVRDDWGWSLGYSPDGLVGDYGLLEVKSRRQKKHLQTILADEVPAENMAQLQAGLLVSGREWIDYVSFSGGMPLWVKRVYPDPGWFTAIVEAVAAFEQAAEQMVDTYLDRTEGLPVTERRIETDLGLVF